MQGCPYHLTSNFYLIRTWILYPLPGKVLILPMHEPSTKTKTQRPPDPLFGRSWFQESIKESCFADCYSNASGVLNKGGRKRTNSRISEVRYSALWVLLFAYFALLEPFSVR